MKLSKKVIIIIAVVLVCLVGGGIAFATNTPTARAERQLNLGNKYLQEGKYQEAILAFQKVIEIEPKNIPARLGLGKAYIATNEYDKAETVLKEVIGIDSNNIPAREELFKVYVNEGNLDAANGVLKEITALDPNKDTKQFNSDLDLAKAISTSKVSYELGIKQMNDKQYLEAIDSFQKVIKEDTERYDDAQAKIADCKKTFVDETLKNAKDAAGNKDYQTALDLLEQVLKVDPDNPEALQLKSDYQKELIENSTESIVMSNSTKHYQNYKFGFSIDYPSTFTIEDPPPFLRDGTTVHTSDKRASINIYGSNVYYGSNVERDLNYEYQLELEHSNILYKEIGTNWYIVSWAEGDSIAYTKGIVGKCSMNAFLIKYPKAEQQVYSSVINLLSSSFKTPGIDQPYNF